MASHVSSAQPLTAACAPMKIAASLQGHRPAEHLFALKQALDAFDFCARQLAECDSQIEAQLAVLQATEAEPARGKKRSKARNAPKFDLRSRLFKMCGVDLTRIDGIDVTTARVVMSEVGADMSKFPDDKHFASWLGLCPGTKITGGKVMSGKTARVANRASQALKLAAAARDTPCALHGHAYRRTPQPCHQELLRPTSVRRQAAQSRSGGLHAQALDHAQRHGQNQQTRGQIASRRLTSKTVTQAKKYEPLLFFRGVRVVDEAGALVCEHSLRILERDAVLLTICLRFPWIPTRCASSSCARCTYIVFTSQRDEQMPSCAV